VPDDERTRRRLGDATKSRIADLASGWSVEAAPDPLETPEPIELTPEPEPVPAPPRARRKTQPPPPPGSKARHDLENAILDSVETPPPVKVAPDKPAELDVLFGARPDTPRTKPPTAPPKAPPRSVPADAASSPSGGLVLPKLPPSPQRSKQPSVPPPIPGPSSPKGKPAIKSGPTETGTVAVIGSIGSTGSTPAPELEQVVATTPERDDATDVSPPPPSKPVASSEPRVTVPRGEFESASSGAATEVEAEKLRIAYEQSTLKRDAANALLKIAEAPETVVKPQPVEVLLSETAEMLRSDPTKLESPETNKFERGDPTLGPNDPTIASTATLSLASTGTLRAQAALRRKRGLAGDVKYVLTVMFGVRKARQELTALEAKQALRQQSRRRHLITLGRAAATLDGFDHPARGPACEALISVEDERSQHAAAVTAADAELQRVRRDREAKAKQHAEEHAKLDTELADLAKKLEPLDKEVATIGKRADDLKQALRKLDIKIANTEMSQHSVAGARERAAIQAEIATFKADRVAVQRDEPKLASELDALNPRIAALDARRAEIKRRKTEIDSEELEDQRRCDELLAAIGAKRKVVDRAASDAETLRDKILFDLGDRLYVDHPADLAPQLSPIDVIDVELGTGDRRQMELKEILSSVDRAKLGRGIAVVVAAVVALTAITLLVLGVF